MAFVNNGVLDMEGLYEAQALSARAGYRVATIELELPKWNEMQSRDRLIGTSLTGWQDMVNATGMNIEEQKTLASNLRKVAKDAAYKYADSLKMNRPELVTSIKPEGCWTKDHIRTTDQGILFIDELKKELDFGFSDIDGFSSNSNEITKVYKNEKKTLRRITLKNGRKLDVTPTHPMSVNNNWVMSKNIKLGSILDYSLGNYKNEMNVKLNCDVDLSSYRSDIRDYILPEIVSEDLAWLLGAYYANGSLTTSDRIKFHCEHLYIHEKIQKLWRDLFGVTTQIVKSSDRNSYTQDFRSTKIRRWLELNGFDKPNNFDRIPLKIRKSSYKAIISFIVGYADNDGCFYEGSFCIDSSNEIFLRHLQEVGESIGLSFGLSVNSKRGKGAFTQNYMYKLHMSRAFTLPETIDYINVTSEKAKLKPLKKGSIRSKNPYTVISNEEYIEDITYDIEVEDVHWYYQGALKSHNTLSQLPTVSSGLHFSHSPYYVRRIRINSADPLAKVCEELGYPMYPEVGQEWETCRTKVIEFPVKAPIGKTKYNVSAIEQLEIYKMFMEEYVDHNASNTISVADGEWDSVIQWVYDNWDSVIGITFLSLDDSFYKLLPYEAITEKEYNERVSQMKPFIPSLISKYEIANIEFEADSDPSCGSGACPIR